MEAYSIHQIAELSGWSHDKIKNIKSYWLKQQPPVISFNLSKCKYLVVDGTYFNHDFCLLVLYDSKINKVISFIFTKKEDYRSAVEWFYSLCKAGLYPVSITSDGSIGILRAICEIWPGCKVQRCLYHVKSQGERWLRLYPRTKLAQDLKYIIGQVCSVSNKELFWDSYLEWKRKYDDHITILNRKDKVEGDIISTYHMFESAYKDLFYYLEDENILRTSNVLEGYFGHLKRKYRQHSGLRRSHLTSYLVWYIYFNNSKK